MAVASGLGVVSTAEHAAAISTQLLGFAAMAALLGAVVAVVYRTVIDEAVQPWLAVAVGAGGVALYLGIVPVLDEIVRDGVEIGEVEAALFNVAGLVIAGGGALFGRRVGDRFGQDVILWSPTADTGEDVSRLAQAVGQVTAVSLPTTIHDAAGYDPIPDRTKSELEGKKLVFPRALTPADLQSRVEKRLREDYGIGEVDMEVEDGAVTYLAVGTRAAGIGATLPPATNAVALRADPGFAASTGDIVQVWETDPMQRVLTGELRGVAGEVVTIAIDATDTPKVDPRTNYRLVTLPVDDRPDREFASLLRMASETFSTATVEAGSPLHGMPVGALDLTVVAIRPEGIESVPFPDSTYRLAPGDLLFVIARPGELRRLEIAGEALDPALVESPEAGLPTDEEPPTESIETSDPAVDREMPTAEDGLPASASDGPEPPAEESAEPTADTDTAAGAGEKPASAIDPDASTDSFESTEDGEELVNAAAEETTTFEDLKEDFESGEADWDESSTEPDVEVAFENDESGNSKSEARSDSGGGDDGLVSLEEAEISFEDEPDDSETDHDEAEEDSSLGDLAIDEELQGEAEDPLSDDISNLEFEDDDDEEIDGLDLSDETGPFDVEDDEMEEAGGNDGDSEDGNDEEGDEDTDDEDEDGKDDDESGGSSSGGGKSFADLKKEFESGDADWDDDVSDSPGGDMRLDE